MEQTTNGMLDPHARRMEKAGAACAGPRPSRFGCRHNDRNDAINFVNARAASYAPASGEQGSKLCPAHCFDRSAPLYIVHTEQLNKIIIGEHNGGTQLRPEHIAAPFN